MDTPGAPPATTPESNDPVTSLSFEDLAAEVNKDTSLNGLTVEGVKFLHPLRMSKEQRIRFRGLAKKSQQDARAAEDLDSDGDADIDGAFDEAEATAELLVSTASDSVKARELVARMDPAMVAKVWELWEKVADSGEASSSTAS